MVDIIFIVIIFGLVAASIAFVALCGKV